MSAEPSSTPRRSARFAQSQANLTASSSLPSFSGPISAVSSSSTAQPSSESTTNLEASPASRPSEEDTDQNVSYDNEDDVELQAAQALTILRDGSQQEPAPSLSPAVLEPPMQTSVEIITNPHPLLLPAAPSAQAWIDPAIWTMPNPPQHPAGPVRFTEARQRAPSVIPYRSFTGYHPISSWYAHPLLDGNYFPPGPVVTVWREGDQINPEAINQYYEREVILNTPPAPPRTLPSLRDIIPQFEECRAQGFISRTTHEDIQLRRGSSFEQRLVAPAGLAGSSNARGRPMPVELDVGTNEDMWIWDDRVGYHRDRRAVYCLPPSLGDGRRRDACRDGGL
ncbi:hypothetical protein F5Y18DRAFT_445040 [Xylariaceae sp. FL1019]|nr:hypothetical protein F5Y18DRAFT_445040 [Xylariaceae sp. FL1019]